MPHKFKVGQAVEYHPPREIYAPRGTYVVTAELPERDGEFEYHIRSVNEPHERVVKETELRVIAVDDNTPGAPEPKTPRRK
jgi:hypothetical protein